MENKINTIKSPEKGNTMKRIANTLSSARGLLKSESGDQMTGWLIVVLVVVVVGAVFMTCTGFHHQHGVQHRTSLLTNNAQPKRLRQQGRIVLPFFMNKNQKLIWIICMMTTLKNKMQRMGLKTRKILASKSGTDDRWLIVVLILCLWVQYL